MNKPCLLSCKASDRHLDYFNCRLHRCKMRPSYFFLYKRNEKMKKKVEHWKRIYHEINTFFHHCNNIKRFSWYLKELLLCELFIDSGRSFHAALPINNKNCPEWSVR